MYMYDTFVHGGGGDNEFCGVGENTVLWGYDLGCDVDWRQILVFSAMAWFFGTAAFFPIVLAISFVFRVVRRRS
jgi:hypothetical protein